MPNFKLLIAAIFTALLLGTMAIPVFAVTYNPGVTTGASLLFPNSYYSIGVVLGVNFKDLIPKTPVKLEDLGGKIIAIDAYNAIYQFLSASSANPTAPR